MKQLLTFDYTQRISPGQALTHRYFDSIRSPQSPDSPTQSNAAVTDNASVTDQAVVTLPTLP